ncbi:RcpC/CpaB family pilus assembly protein [Streptomyces phaeoluteigriseus]|uniref:RcpC/CpaB family pilus assembly protein n=1 Tax=Streptomyces phaeoluteigriseus TaxID=114686 RepID=A0ABY4ZIV8_9ACTN|nr:RcpC/CpaB family pilus assembly protein [Streptomyces phaeoluteigriseus]USQ88846.1 RcpC/CpaB family pilus assembly protein [Streptomyces phaeoluteigriseus]
MSPPLPVPPSCEVPQFAPVRVRGGPHLLHRWVRNRRRALAVGLALTAAALVAAGPRDGDPPRGPGEGAHARARSSARAPADGPRTAGRVRAAVRITDAATVRLLRPGDRVDVIAVAPAERAAGPDGEAQVVARGALVTKVPETAAAPVGAGEEGTAWGDVDSGDGGALVVLSVPRSTATRLAGASAAARLVVTLW